MVSDKIVDFRFFVKIYRSGPAIIFSFWTSMEQVSYPSKKLLIKTRFIRTSSRLINNFQFLNHHGASELSIKKAPYQAKIYQDLIKMMSVTLEKLWLVSDRIVDFRFFVKFHRSGTAIIFSFWTSMEQVSYPSKKLLIKTRFIRTSSRQWVLLWKNYGWFLIDFRFFVKLHRSGPAIIFSFWTILEDVSYP